VGGVIPFFEGLVDCVGVCKEVAFENFLFSWLSDAGYEWEVMIDEKRVHRSAQRQKKQTY
jgi:hypothetical protein